MKRIKAYGKTKMGYVETKENKKFFNDDYSDIFSNTFDKSCGDGKSDNMFENLRSSNTVSVDDSKNVGSSTSVGTKSVLDQYPKMLKKNDNISTKKKNDISTKKKNDISTKKKNNISTTKKDTNVSTKKKYNFSTIKKKRCVIKKNSENIKAKNKISKVKNPNKEKLINFEDFDNFDFCVEKENYSNQKFNKSKLNQSEDNQQFEQTVSDDIQSCIPNVQSSTISRRAQNPNIQTNLKNNILSKDNLKQRRIITSTPISHHRMNLRRKRKNYDVMENVDTNACAELFPEKSSCASKMLKTNFIENVSADGSVVELFPDKSTVSKCLLSPSMDAHGSSMCRFPLGTGNELSTTHMTSINSNKSSRKPSMLSSSSIPPEECKIQNWFIKTVRCFSSIEKRKTMRICSLVKSKQEKNFCNLSRIISSTSKDKKSASPVQLSGSISKRRSDLLSSFVTLRNRKPIIYDEMLDSVGYTNEIVFSGLQVAESKSFKMIVDNNLMSELDVSCCMEKTVSSRLSFMPLENDFVQQINGSKQTKLTVSTNLFNSEFVIGNAKKVRSLNYPKLQSDKLAKSRRKTKSCCLLNRELVNNSILNVSDSKETHEQLKKPADCDPEEVTLLQAELLNLCEQKEVIQFSDAYNWTSSAIEKIGEGSYGEVFMIKERRQKKVLKIVPLDLEKDLSKSKAYEHIVAEIKVAQCMSNLRDNEKYNTPNFCKLEKSHVVKGFYPSKLIDAWNIFESSKRESYNSCPRMYNSDQLYVIFEIEYCGEVLGNYKIKNAVESESIFKQVALSLAIAEKMYQFEHRDLHLGNILIQKTNKTSIKYTVDGRQIFLPSCRILVKIIDFTFSHITSTSGIIYFHNLAEDLSLFEQTGDFQFDVYRYMKGLLGNEWQRTDLYSNVLWLNYLSEFLMEYKYRYPKSQHHKICLKKIDEYENVLMQSEDANDFILKSNILSELQKDMQETKPRTRNYTKT